MPSTGEDERVLAPRYNGENRRMTGRVSQSPSPSRGACGQSSCDGACALTPLPYVSQSSLVKAKPPRVLSFRFGWGGYFGGYTTYEWRRGVLRICSTLNSDEAVEVTPTPARWIAFSKEVEACGVWKWKKQYWTETLDGAEWSLRLSIGNRTIKSSGMNAYPNYDGSSNDDPNVTEAFAKFRRAVARLAGRRTFAYMPRTVRDPTVFVAKDWRPVKNPQRLIPH